MTATIATVENVRRHGDNLTIVTVRDGDATHEVVANLDDNGSPRWKEGEILVYCAEGSIIPEDVLREQHYWDDANPDKNRGLLEGKRGNRVKMRKFAGFESRGLLFKTTRGGFLAGVPGADDLMVRNGQNLTLVHVGDDVSEFLGITEHAA